MKSSKVKKKKNVLQNISNELMNELNEKRV